MFHEKMIIVALLALVTAIGCQPELDARVDARSSCQEDGARMHPQAAQLQDALERAISARLPGAILYVADERGRWTGAAGFANMATRRQMQTCTPHRIASVTKSFMALTALRLVQQGELSLDDPIDRWLTPQRAAQFERSDRVTIRQLLDHSSGYANFTLPISINLFNRPWQTWTTDQALDLAATQGRLFDEPGLRHDYANTNYLLLAEVLEGATGRRHEELLSALVFEPAGLKRTTYKPNLTTLPEDIDSGYMELHAVGELVDVTQTYALNVIGPDGGIISTAADVGKLLRAIFDTQELLDDELRGELEQWRPVESEWGFDGYGLGFGRWVTPYGVGIGHTGQEFGYLTFAYHFPQTQTTFVLMTNASSISVPIEGNTTHTVLSKVLPELLRATFEP